ncbi:chloroplast polyribonucleotide phosphorylase [Dunaliella salina]|uniref:polyribonucleotide nucleotidyltransferase n=1 Tax=Dunaliella salina TaxID=3046 RepID=A0ABQ7G1E0_DUNSA|nr:chloroplast polyribonucleotide phosphorylase [Dunaliella salina]|eukprot:KAF5828424.1 chloroplast polyribonucleotide phosphorylase [Dunaliella salina]
MVGLAAKCPNRPPLSRAQQQELLGLCPSKKHQQRVVRCAAAAAEEQQGDVASTSGPPQQPAGLQPLRFELDAGCQQMMILETGEVGRQANGSIMAIQGETVIYTTACCSDKPTGDGSFVPLTINYQERFSAAGKTSGGYIKRDGRPRDSEVLQWVLSYDNVNSPDPLAITAGSVALLVSDIPFEKAVAGVRVGWIDGKPVVNPTVVQQKEKKPGGSSTSKLDLVLAGTRDAILMIEGYCDFLTEEQMLEALEAGSKVVMDMCRQIESWEVVVAAAKTKRMHQLVLPPPELEDRVHALVGEQLYRVYSQISTKAERNAAQEEAWHVLQRELMQPPQDGAASVEPAVSHTHLEQAYKAIRSKVMRDVVMERGLRMDGRGTKDIRPISSRARFLPRTHGSCLFTRGETQAIAVTTLGSRAAAQRIDSMRVEPNQDTDEAFYLQYFFPPSSVGETGRVGGPGRRELGHGELAERALLPVIPSQDVFPYTVRVESTITESNGSSSMASVCGGCLSMLDAGVPLPQPVAGIAMGLLLDTQTKKFVVLSDILGSEDALGDMDFKVAGGHDAITAFQMDIKVEGITIDILRQALSQAGEGRRHILGEMEKCSPPPRRELAEYTPRVIRKPVDPDMRGEVIGSGGKIIRRMVELSGVTAMEMTDYGLEIVAPNKDAAAKAIEMVDNICKVQEKGKIFENVPVSSVTTFGAFVELSPGCEGLVHISELDYGFVADASQIIKVGERMNVVVLEHNNGRMSLSRKRLLAPPEGGDAGPTGSAAAGNMGLRSGVTSETSADRSTQQEGPKEKSFQGGLAGRGGRTPGGRGIGGRRGPIGGRSGGPISGRSGGLTGGRSGGGRR